MEKAASFIADKKNANLFVDVIDDLKSEDVDTVLSGIKAVHKICSHLLGTGQIKSSSKLTPPSDSADKAKVYEQWIQDRYRECWESLVSLLSHDNTAIQALALCSLMKFLKVDQHKGLLIHQLQKIISGLLQSPQDLTKLLRQFNEFMGFDDVRYHTMKSATREIQNFMADKEKNWINLNNVYNLLTNLSMPECVAGDKLNNLYVTHSESCVKLKCCSLKLQKKAFQVLWMEFLKQELSDDLFRQVLLSLDSVLPFMSNPLLLGDFLTETYNRGGVISLLALNTLFILMHSYNLDYPDFFTKLYALLEPSVLHVKYRARFLFLLDLFLTSTHIPAYMVAAFVKKLARLSLTASTSALAALVPLILNLIIRHDACKPMLHRPNCKDLDSDPFDPDETDMSKCQALDSSLWELKTLTEHYHHSISSAAKLILQPLPKNETDLSDLLDTQIDELMQKEKKKAMKGDVSTTFVPPTGLFSKQDNLWLLE